MTSPPMEFPAMKVCQVSKFVHFRFARVICLIVIVAVGAATLVGGIATPSMAQEQEPKTPRAIDLLPNRTGLFLQVDNFPQLVEDFKNSNFGRMMKDEKMAPFLDGVIGEAMKTYETVQDDVGFSLEEFKSLPTGQICFAITAPRRDEPRVVLIADLPTDSDLAQRLIDRGLELATDNGGTVEEGEEVGSKMKYQILREGGGGNDDAYFLFHEGLLIASNNEEELQDIIARWQGTATKKVASSFAENRKFVTVMNKCKSAEDLPMAFAGYIDPIMLTESAVSKSVQGKLVLAFIRAAGMDQLSAIGGAALFDEAGYESIFHLHALVTQPRSGVFEMLALKPGFYEPEPFIPADVATYITSNWNVPQFMSELEVIVDKNSGEGNFREGLKMAKEQLGMDLETELIQNLDGRITYVSWINEKPTIDAQAHALIIKAIDEDKAISFAKNLIEKTEDQMGEFSNNFETDTYNGITIWKQEKSTRQFRRDRRDIFRARNEGVEVKDLEPRKESSRIRADFRDRYISFTFIDGYFIFTETPELLELMIDTYSDESEKLIDDPEFLQTIDETKELLDTSLPSMLFYARPAETMRMIFDTLNTDNTRQIFEQQANGIDRGEGMDEGNGERKPNEFFAGVLRVMDENPLPAFEDIAHYFPPQGGFVVNDESGFHLLFFQKKAKDRE